MADTNHNRREDYMEFSENDPFAELARIMGHDPRAQEPAAPVQAVHAAADMAAVSPDAYEDDFDLDLEKELAGEFDFAEFDQPAAVADWRDETPAGIADQAPAQDAHVEASQYEPAVSYDPEQYDTVSLDAEFEDFFRENEAIAEPVEATPAYEPAAYRTAEPAVYAPAVTIEDDIEDALERELFAADEAFEDVEQPQHDAAYQAAYQQAGNYDVPVDVTSRNEEPVYATATAQAHVSEADDETWTEEAEFDLDFLERELAAASAPAVTAAVASVDMCTAYEAPIPATEPEPVAAHPVEQAFEVQAAEAAPAELSLEDELNLLLADDTPPAAAPVAAAVAASTVAAMSAATAERPSISYFGRANFTSPQVAAAPAAAVAYRPEEIESAAVPAFEPEPMHEPVEPIETAVAQQPAPEPEPVIVPSPAAAMRKDEFEDIFGDDFALDLDADSVPAKTGKALPEIETVEVAESVQPVIDDLDIPEIDYAAPGEKTQRPYDDLDADFANVFSDLGMEEPQQPKQAAAAPAAVAPAQQPYVLHDTQWQAEQQGFSDNGFDYETDLEQAIAMSGYDDEEVQPAPRRRGLLIAAVLAGVAIVGGVGVLGMSMFGGGSDAPALVRADSDPMKVRPENPGGATVPNQDNEVYQRVTGGASDAAPSQERLITTAEEPVDLAARSAAEEPSVLAPGIDDGEGALLPKAEDRIEPTAEAASPTTAGETAMVTPRRVRTMVVRPDGTMVPREELAPAAPEQVAAAPQQPAPATATELQPMVPAPAGEAAAPLAGVPLAGADATLDDGPTLDMPETVAVVPTQRSEPRAAAPAQPATPVAQPAVQQPAVQAPVAAAPVSAPAAAAPSGATSEWSMQIASQPTAEGAQSTYQDLARRYGNVLEGRGVNIVRADIDGRGTYYRVRIPASSRDEAIQLCTRYKTAGGSCFVSR